MATAKIQNPKAKSKIQKQNPKAIAKIQKQNPVNSQKSKS
jgi:hypothetical protein